MPNSISASAGTIGELALICIELCECGPLLIRLFSLLWEKWIEGPGLFTLSVYVPVVPTFLLLQSKRSKRSYFN